MAKKIVRGITDVKTINNQDFDTNNVNDLLSDGQYNYIHRKKGKSEEYHNLTDNIKTLSSDNTELLSVTNNNKTTNTATLHPKHDSQKEQVLESTRNTVTINHGTNGTSETTKVDTNPQKVLEHENLLTDYGISKTTSGNTTILGLEYTRVAEGYDLNNLLNGRVRAGNFLNAPQSNKWFFVSAATENQHTIQRAINLLDQNNPEYVRIKRDHNWGEWREQVGDKSVIDGLLAQKEQVLESTRNTVTINHGENGTAEKTKVDTNPQKVLEHENLISDSEYITLDHQTDVNKTHIKTDALKQQLDWLYETISSIGGTTTTTTLKRYTVGTDWGYSAFKQVVKSGATTLVTFTFDCAPTYAEREVTDQIKNDLENFVSPGMTVSNGAITISNDGTNIKLIKSGGSQNVSQQGTFTFFDGSSPL